MVDLEIVAAKIRSIYKQNPDEALELIEGYLDELFKGLPIDEKCALLKKIRRLFEPSFQGESVGMSQKSSPWFEMARLLLGRLPSNLDLDSLEVGKRLTRALNTLFESINELMEVINSTLGGEKKQLTTIRQVINKSMFGDESLQEYMKKLKRVFLVSYEASKLAAESQVTRVLKDLNPKDIERELQPGMKFGPLRKAELYDIFCHRYYSCQRWLEKGHFKEDYLREFEKKCQELLKKKDLII